jgi:hypothetical protein
VVYLRAFFFASLPLLHSLAGLTKSKEKDGYIVNSAQDHFTQAFQLTKPKVNKAT